MCGLLGHFSFQDAPGSWEPWRAATQRLIHRGPDSGGWWAWGPWFLGHRRLAIIGLADGQQPMHSADGQLAVVFNGEIYNDRELRRELAAEGARFRTAADTEVLLHGYRAWGWEGLLQRLIGMFAIALVDRRAGCLLLARDRFGEKPLLYRHTPRGMTFASDVAALLAAPDGDAVLDDDALAGYLCLNYVPGEKTLVRGVRRLAPGEWRGWWRDGRASGGHYWTPPDPRPHAMDTEEALAEAGRLLDVAVATACRSDVPLTLFLSGGIDSSLVAVRAARQGGVKTAYCLDFVESGSHSELSKARLVAERLGLELRPIPCCAPTAEQFLTVAARSDEPLADSSALAVLILARGVAADFKVALSGDGGDELFGGYLTYQATQLHARFGWPLPGGVRRGLAGLARWIPAGGDGKVTPLYKLRRFLRAVHLPPGEAHFTWNGAWTPAQAARLLGRGGSVAALREVARRRGLADDAGLLALQRADLGEYLVNDILMKVDRMTMAHGLESRAPFLYPELARFALTLPPHLKCPLFGPPKKLLRELARRELGADIADAPKQGFSGPVHRWLRGPLRGVMASLLTPDALAPLGLLDAVVVGEAVARHLAGRDQLGFELWGLMTLVAWHRQVVQAPPPLPAFDDLPYRPGPDTPAPP